MAHKDIHSCLSKAMFCTYTYSLTYIYTRSEIPDMQLCQVLHCPIAVPALEAGAEIRHTTDSEVFMMAKASNI